jgi:hypothetical protein
MILNWIFLFKFEFNIFEKYVNFRLYLLFDLQANKKCAIFFIDPLIFRERRSSNLEFDRKMSNI